MIDSPRDLAWRTHLAARHLPKRPRSRQDGVPLPTLNKIEAGTTDPKLTTAGKLRRTLEDAGVIFVDPTADHGVGVILREGKRVPRKG